jgi:hypothetical protein
VSRQGRVGEKNERRCEKGGARREAQVWADKGNSNQPHCIPRRRGAEARGRDR